MSPPRPSLPATVIGLLALVVSACSTSGAASDGTVPTTIAGTEPTTTTEPAAPEEPEATDDVDPADDASTTTASDPAGPGDGEGDDEGYDPHSEALAVALTSRKDFAWSDPTAPYCIAPRWIRAIGIDTLEAAGVDPDTIVLTGFSALQPHIAAAEATAMVEALRGCGIDPGSFLAEQLHEGRGYPLAMGECIADHGGPAWTEAFLVGVFDGTAAAGVSDPALVATFTEAVGACG